MLAGVLCALLLLRARRCPMPTDEVEMDGLRAADAATVDTDTWRDLP